MAALGATPEEFGLKVRTSPAGLEITARNKMRRSQLVKVSYSGDIPETVNFDMRDSVLTGNLTMLERFTGRLDDGFRCSLDPETGSVVWTGVTADEIIDGFLHDYAAGPAPRTRPTFIADYIRSCQRLGELGSWTVRLVSSLDGDPWRLGEHSDLGLIKRKHKNDDIEAGERYRIGRLVSPSDEGKDLIKGSELWNRALDAARIAAAAGAAKDGKPRKEPEFPAGPPLRRQRPPEQAHLLIYPLGDPRSGRVPDAPPVVGFAISFPCSAYATRTAVEYRVNDVWQKQALGADYVQDDE
jgi:hypothetical protein